MSVVFIGHFSDGLGPLNAASSIAGNQVQRQIFREISERVEDEKATCFSMEPVPAWPKGPILVWSKSEERVRFIGFLNLPVLKHIVFAIRLFFQLQKHPPDLCVQYNAYLWENLTLLCTRALNAGMRISLIVQDVHVNPGLGFFSKRGIRSRMERIAMRLARNFDLVIAVTPDILKDFQLNPLRCIVFPGGVTEFAGKLARTSADKLEDFAVFAGALEAHNGIEQLIERWESLQRQVPLHVFGKGQLASLVSAAAQRCANIRFHGFQPEHVIYEWHCRARWNVCLRYSEGLDQRYFFPSKFFNVVCAPGVVLVNDFHALPQSLRKFLVVLDDGLTGLEGALLATRDGPVAMELASRREIVRSEYDWSAAVSQLFCAIPPQNG